MSSSKPSSSAPITVKSDLLVGIGAGAEYVMPAMPERAARGRSAGNNLPLVALTDRPVSSGQEQAGFPE
jgi:hypothetical protein